MVSRGEHLCVMYSAIKINENFIDLNIEDLKIDDRNFPEIFGIKDFDASRNF